MTFPFDQAPAYRPEAHEVIMDAFINKITDRFVDHNDENMIESTALRQGNRRTTNLTLTCNGQRLREERWDPIKQFAQQQFMEEGLEERGFKVELVDVPSQVIIIKKITE